MLTADHYCVLVEIQEDNSPVQKYYLDRDFLTDGESAFKRMSNLVNAGNSLA